MPKTNSRKMSAENVTALQAYEATKHEPVRPIRELFESFGWDLDAEVQKWRAKYARKAPRRRQR